MNPKELLAFTKGIPLIHDDFDTHSLLVAVASLRSQIDAKNSKNLKYYLSPEVALALYSQKSGGKHLPPETIEFPQNEQDKLKGAINTIVTTIPGWEAAFAIPVRYKRLVSNMTAMTNRWLPQHIYLGERAFLTPLHLQESLVHEMSHVWCGLLLEIFSFQLIDSPKNLVLPSGTGDKDINGVLLAALFAASALKYYNAVIDRSPSVDAVTRAQYLADYLNKSIDIVDGHIYLTEMGLVIVSMLKSTSSILTRQYFQQGA